MVNSIKNIAYGVVIFHAIIALGVFANVASAQSYDPHGNYQHTPSMSTSSEVHYIDNHYSIGTNADGIEFWRQGGSPYNFNLTTKNSIHNASGWFTIITNKPYYNATPYLEISDQGSGSRQHACYSCANKVVSTNNANYYIQSIKVGNKGTDSSGYIDTINPGYGTGGFKTYFVGETANDAESSVNSLSDLKDLISKAEQPDPLATADLFGNTDPNTNAQVNITTPSDGAEIPEVGTTSISSSFLTTVEWDYSDFTPQGIYHPTTGSTTFSRAGLSVYDVTATTSSTPVYATSTSIIAESGSADFTIGGFAEGSFDIQPWIKYSSGKIPLSGDSILVHSISDREVSGFNDDGTLYTGTPGNDSMGLTPENLSGAGSQSSFQASMVAGALESLKTETPLKFFYELADKIQSIDAVPIKPDNVEVSLGNLGTLTLVNTAEAKDIVDVDGMDGFHDIVISFFWFATAIGIMLRVSKFASFLSS